MPFEANIQPETIARKHLAFDSVAQVVRASESSTADYRVRVSGADTQAEYLFSKFVAGVATPIGTIDFEKIADAQGKESIRVKLTNPASMPASGQLLQSNGTTFFWGGLPAHIHDDRYYTTTQSDARYAGINHTHTGFAATNHTHAIADVSNLQAVLNGKSNTGHTHPISEIANLQAALDAKSNVGHTHDYAPSNHLHDDRYSLLGHTHSGFANAVHIHVIGDVTGLQDALNGKSNTGHLHDDRYSQIGHTHSGYALTSHGHSISEITSLQSEIGRLDGRIDYRLAGEYQMGGTGFLRRDGVWANPPITSHTHGWDEITGKPTSFTPSTHSHGISDVMGLQANLDGKSNVGHIHDDRYYTETESDTKFAVVNHTHSQYALATHTHAEYANASSGYGTSLIKSGNTLKSITVNGSSPLLQISEAFDTIEIGAKTTDSGNWSRFYRGDGTFQTLTYSVLGEASTTDLPLRKKSPIWTSGIVYYDTNPYAIVVVPIKIGNEVYRVLTVSSDFPVNPFESWVHFSNA